MLLGLSLYTCGIACGLWVGVPPILVTYNAPRCRVMYLFYNMDGYGGKWGTSICPRRPSHTLTSEVETRNNRGIPRPARSVTSGRRGELNSREG